MKCLVVHDLFLVHIKQNVKQASSFVTHIKKIKKCYTLADKTNIENKIAFI